MSWIILAAVFVAGTIATFTDWYFMGVLFHDRYQAYPETWWPRARSRIDADPLIHRLLAM